MNQCYIKVASYGVLMLIGLTAVSAGTFLLLTKDLGARKLAVGDDETRESREAFMRRKIRGWGVGLLAMGVIAVCTALNLVL